MQPAQSSTIINIPPPQATKQSKWNAANTARNVTIIAAETFAWGTSSYAFFQGIHVAMNIFNGVCPVELRHASLTGYYIGGFVIASYLKTLQYYHTGEIKLSFPEPY